MTHDNPRTKNALNLIAACAAVVACARDELATLEHGNDLTPGAVLINADTDKRRSELATLMLNAEHTARATLTLVREGRAT